MVCNQNKKLPRHRGNHGERLNDSAEPFFGYVSHQLETMVMLISGVRLSS